MTDSDNFDLGLDWSIDYSKVFDDGVDESGVEINVDRWSRQKASHILVCGTGQKIRLRLKESLTHLEWTAVQQTCSNITGGKMGKGVLFQRSPFFRNVETAFLKGLTFGMLCKYVILEHFLDVPGSKALTVNDWQTFCEKHIPDTCEEEKVDEELKTYRFADKTLSFRGPKRVADAFHDSALKWEIVQTPDRCTGGLTQFTCPRPARSFVSAARKKLFFLLPAQRRFPFCVEQLFGDTLDVDACLHIIRCQSPDDVHIDIGLGSRKKPRLQEKDTEERHVEHASRSREGSRQSSKTEAYLKERAEQAEQEAREKDSELDRLRKELEKYKLEQEAAQETPQETPQQQIGVKIEDSDDDSVTSEERNRFFREMDLQQEQYERARDEREIEQYGLEGHELRKRRRLSQYDSSYALTFVEMRNTYRTMRDKERVIQIELRVWLPVLLFACYFALMEYGAAYIHEEEYLYALDDRRLQGSNEMIIYAFIFLCSLIMLVFFASGIPTACDWFYGLVIMPATRLCFASNQGYASMIAVILLCSQNRKPLLLVEFLGVICFVIFAPLANRFVFAGRLILSLVFYQNRMINHIDHRTPTIFLSPWRELILTVMFVSHCIFDKLELFFCGCGGH